MTQWIDVTTIGDLLLRAGERWPEREAVAFTDSRHSYADLVRGARRVARGLHALGVRRGDHVGLLMPNVVEAIHAFFGAALAGAVACPLNARYGSAELAYVIENADHVVVLTSDRVEEHVDLVGRLRTAFPELGAASPGQPLAIAGVPQLRHVVALGGAEGPGVVGDERFGALAESVPDAIVDETRANVRIRDIALMLYTSGTTATPKGCVSTHEAFVRGSRAAQACWRVSEVDVVWNPMPLFHHAALQPLAYTLDVGGRFCSMTHYAPEAAIEQIARERPTLLEPLFPPFVMTLIHHPRFGELDLSSLRLVFAIGARDQLRQVQAAVPNVPLCQGTGLTESGGLIVLGDLEADPELAVTTIGWPFPGVEVRVVDEDGNDLPPEVPGELLIRGFTTFEGYYKDPEQTAITLDADGWVHSGDRYTKDASGRIDFLGRIKEMMKVGGENVAPAEIESHVATHPAVQLVQAVGVPDPRLDEVPAIFVELRPGADATAEELVAHCRGAIASFKVPRYVRFVTEWPMSATKIQKFRLREALLEELGMEETASA